MKKKAGRWLRGYFNVPLCTRSRALVVGIHSESVSRNVEVLTYHLLSSVFSRKSLLCHLKATLPYSQEGSKVIPQSEFWVCNSSTWAIPLPYFPCLWLTSCFLWFASNLSLTLAPLVFLAFDLCVVKCRYYYYSDMVRSTDKERIAIEKILLLVVSEWREHITPCRKHQS